VSGPPGAYVGGDHDEMRAADGTVREGWAALAALVHRSRPAALAAATRRLLADEGVTYRPPGEHEQPWALDPLPLPLTAATWAELEAGAAQRALLLDRLLADLYGPRLTLRTGLLPVEVVLGHPGFVHGWARATPRPRELFLAGTDLVRTPEGWRVLGDRVQAPSGAGYALPTVGSSAACWPPSAATPRSAASARSSTPCAAAWRSSLPPPTGHGSCCSPPAPAPRRPTSRRCWRRGWGSRWCWLRS
jgi:uncharacterized circularly permuted ATP-grasp superfamily protein